MLKVNKDVRDTDYVDYLQPFVLEVLRSHRPDPVHDQTVADHLKTDFGLWVPNRGIQLVLGRLRRPGVVEKRDGVFRLAGDIPDTGMPLRQSDAKRRIDVLLNQIVDFANEEFAVSWTSDDAADVLKGYLSEFGIECLRTYLHYTALPDIPKKVPKDIRVIHTFVREAHRNSVERFDNFILVVKGNMLANALLCPDIQSLQQKFDRVTFYLDTGFLLRVLGLGSQAQNEAARDLLRLITELRGRLAVFEHTIEEVIRVSKSAEANFNKLGTVPFIVRELRSRGQSASDIALVRSQLDRRLNEFHIQRRQAPKHIEEYQIDESILDGALEDEIGYHNPQARVHDLDCIRSVFTLRRDARPVRLEDARAVFVTTNSDLARAAYAFGKQYEHSREVSPVITDFSLANVAWLKAPLGAPDLPEREVLAACYAALEPPAELWGKYLTEVDKLKESSQITEHDHEFLRYDLLAREELMDLTRGEIDALSRETIPQILERAKAAIVAEERDKVEQLAKENQRLREAQNASIARAYWLSERIGTAIAFASAFIFVLATFAVAGVLPKAWMESQTGNYFLGSGIIGVVVLGVVLGLIDQIFGHSVRDLVRWIQRSAASQTFRILRTFFGLESVIAEQGTTI